MEKDTNRLLYEVRQSRIITITLVLLLFFFSYFLITHYPKVGDAFDFYHMATAMNIEKIGHVDLTHVDGGFYILTIIISKIAGISYDIIPTLPLQSVPLILLSVALLKSKPYKSPLFPLLIMSLIIIYITRFPGSYMWWCHGVGFILSLLVILISFFRLRFEHLNKVETSLILMIIIISVNNISYKLTFFTLIFLTSLQIVMYLKNSRFQPKIAEGPGFTQIILIGVTYTLGFNKFFYNSFIPRARIASESATSGIQQLFLRLQNNPFDPLSEYYARTPIGVRYANTLWIVLILTSLALLIVILLQKFIKKKNFHMWENVVVASIVSGLSVFSTYVYLGCGSGSIEFIVFPTLLGFAVLFEENSKNYKKFVIITVLLLLAINLYVAIEDTYNFRNSGMQDLNYYRYMDSPANWYIKHVINKEMPASSDVLTSAYFAKELIKQGIPISYGPHIFSREDMLFLLRASTRVAQINKGDIFIINYRVPHFTGANWATFSSWSNHRQLIDEHPRLNTIYSAGDIAIYSATK